MFRAFVSAVFLVLIVSVSGAIERNLISEREDSKWASGQNQSFDPRVFYSKNCEECHGTSAEKRFNPDSPEGQMIDSILNGAKAEGSRDMPAYAEKGIDESKAKALITYMKSMRE